MKRTLCDEDNDQERKDSLLDLHHQSDECENELSKKPKIVLKTTAMAEYENLFQSNEITESSDNIIAQNVVTNYSDVLESHIIDGGELILFYFYYIARNFHRFGFSAVC